MSQLDDIVVMGGGTLHPRVFGAEATLTKEPYDLKQDPCWALGTSFIPISRPGRWVCTFESIILRMAASGLPDSSRLAWLDT